MNANLQESSFDIEIIKRVIRRRLKAGVIAFVSVMVLVIMVALLLPAVYRSSATVLIEQQEIPQELVRSTVTSFAAQRIQVILQRAMTFSKLHDIIRKYDLYHDLRSKKPLEVVVEEMRADIDHQMISADVIDPRSGKPVEATIAFQISYLSGKPAMAQKVANELISLILEENIRNRNEMADQAESFLGEELERLKQTATILESRLAEFKDKNLRSLPEQTTLNISMLDRADKEVETVRTQIRNLRERKTYLLAKLAQIEPYANVVGDSESRIMTGEARVQYLQNKYLSLLATYSSDHPDVIKAKRELDELVTGGGYELDHLFVEKQLRILREQLENGRSVYASEHPDLLKLERQVEEYEHMLTEEPGSKSHRSTKDADNPAFQQISADIDTTEIEINHLNESLRRIEQRSGVLETALEHAPTVEKEYRDLLRDLENTTSKYQDVKAKQMEAQIAKSLERGRKGERLTLIEPPLIPEQPVKPNRLLILIVGFVLALVLGGAAIWTLEKTDLTIRSSTAIAMLTGASPLAVVPYIVTEDELLNGRKRLRWVSAGFGAAVIIVLVSLHFFFMPLDVLVFVALRKFV